MQLAFDVRQDIERFFGIAGVSLALVDADKDGLTRFQEIRIAENQPQRHGTDNEE